MAIKGLGDYGFGYTAPLANGIFYAVDNGANIINASWGGGGYSRIMEYAIRYAEQHQVLVVVAAGNAATQVTDSEQYYPLCYDAANIVGVAASAQNGELSSFSNFGHRYVDVIAPGSDILSTFPNNEYEKKSGTSMAAPIVSGTAALLLSKNPNVSIQQLKQAFLKGVHKHSYYQLLTASGGLLDVEKSMALIPERAGRESGIPEAVHHYMKYKVYKKGVNQ